jgi:hypothetical protein
MEEEAARRLYQRRRHAADIVVDARVFSRYETYCRALAGSICVGEHSL